MALSIEHEAPIELCREHPEVVPAILEQLLHVQLPYFSRVRVTDPNTRAIIPSGKRSDAAVILEDRTQPVMAAILEPQGKIDPAKWRAWPKYTADLHAELGCDTYLVVLALTRGVATWAKEPIRSFQPGRGFVPYVIGPNEIPRVQSVEAARERPWLTALAALMHANDPDGEQDAVRVLQATNETAGPKQAWWLYQLLRAIMSESHCQRLQEIIMVNPDLYLPKTDFERQQFSRFKAEGKAEALLDLLELRGLHVTDAILTMVRSCTDVNRVSTWWTRALRSSSLDEIFA